MKRSELVSVYEDAYSTASEVVLKMAHKLEIARGNKIYLEINRDIQTPKNNILIEIKNIGYHSV